jgi:prepilin-type N-terminal cleavage/methylation domain-containing protein
MNLSRETIKSRYNHTGFTLIELVVAMSMAAIAVGILFVVWNNINLHVITQQRKSVLYAEVNRISKSITSQIRRSPKVLALHSNGITYISPFSSDTIVYEFFAEELLKNDKPVPVTSQSAYISEFTIEEKEGQMEGTGLTLLLITIALSDEFDNQVNTTSQVAAKVKNLYESDEDFDKWSF